MILDNPYTEQFDNACRSVYISDFPNFRQTGISCGKCGHELKTYYCEQRLYIVWCEHCGVKCFVTASSPKQACYKTMAYPVVPVEDIDEDKESVFWDHVPIDETPAYCGSTIDANFPDDLVCGMELPCCGTYGKECVDKL